MTLPVGISFSGGASSLHMVESIINGETPRPEHVAVFFADTGDEHEWTYEQVDKTEERCRRAGIPFVRTAHRETLSTAIMSAARGERTRLDNPPFWVENQGGSRGQLDQKCTAIFKTAAIRRAQAAWLRSLGLPKRIASWIGFAKDEQGRAVKAVANNLKRGTKWTVLDFPTIRAGKGRAEQRADLDRWGIKPPLFSMCVECPYADPDRIRHKTPKDLAKCIEIDEVIRHGLEHVAVENPAFVTDRLIPIEQLVRRGDPQPSLPGFDPPGCDSGMCFL